MLRIADYVIGLADDGFGALTDALDAVGRLLDRTPLIIQALIGFGIFVPALAIIGVFARFVRRFR